MLLTVSHQTQHSIWECRWCEHADEDQMQLEVVRMDLVVVFGMDQPVFDMVTMDNHQPLMLVVLLRHF
jgi:hypothetical protein